MAEFRKKRKKICHMCAGKPVNYKDVAIISKYINDNGKRIDEYGIYVLKSSKYNSLKDLSEKSFGYLAAEDENKIGQVLDKMDKEIDFSYHKVDEQNELLSKFKNGTYDAIIMQISREDILKEEDNDAYNQLKKIESFKIETTVKTIKSNKDITKEINCFSFFQRHDSFFESCFFAVNHS